MGSRTVILEYRAPQPWSTNDDRRIHWAVRKRRVDEWHQVTRWHYRAARETAPTPAIVTVEIPFAQKRRRDPHNYVGTVVKAIVDALVSEGAWPDDTAEFVTVAEPKLVVGDTVRVTMTRRST